VSCTKNIQESIPRSIPLDQMGWVCGMSLCVPVNPYRWFVI